MKISQDIREDSLRQNGMDQMSETFKSTGGALYVPVDATAKDSTD
jgi:hypothetical protein